MQGDACHQSILLFSSSICTYAKQQPSHITPAVQESASTVGSVGIKASHTSFHLLLFRLLSTLQLMVLQLQQASLQPSSLLNVWTFNSKQKCERWDVRSKVSRVSVKVWGLRSRCEDSGLICEVKGISHGLVSEHPVMTNLSWCVNSQTKFYLKRLSKNWIAPTIHNNFTDFVHINCGISSAIREVVRH